MTINYVQIHAGFSQGKIGKIMSDGVKGVVTIGTIAQLDQYLNAKPGSQIFVNKNIKSLSDELWKRMFSSYEDSEHYDDDVIDKLKANMKKLAKFAKLEKTWKRENKDSTRDVYIKL